MSASDNPADPIEPNAGTEQRGLPAVATAAPLVSLDERQWAMLAHLSALLGYLVTSGWGGSVGGFLGPLIVWLAKKDTMPFVDQQGKEALNFSITICLAFAALVVLLLPITVVTLGLGLLVIIPAFAVVGLYALVFTIIASVKAHEGVAYRYPFALRLIK